MSSNAVMARAFLFAGTVVAASIPGAAIAAERQFSILPQDLSSALKAFGRQSGDTILYRKALTGSIRSNGAVGKLEPEAALARILSGSPFDFKKVDSGFVVIPAASQDPEARLIKTLAMQPAPSPPLASGSAPPAPATVNEVEEVIVTGTSLRGVAPVGSNLVSVGREALQQTGSQTVTGALASVPALSGITGQGTTSAFYQPSIHQLGASASNSTLVLIDGHRGPTGGTNHTFLDPNIVPSIALERVEVLAEGASSLYGSDAVAGVINFITRKRFNGAEAEAALVARDGTLGYSTSAIIGQTWDRGSALIAAEHISQDNLRSSDRAWTYPDHRAQGGGNFLTRFCSPAVIRPGAAGPSIYQTPTSPTPVPNTVDNYGCTTWGVSDLVGKETRTNVMGKFLFELNDKLTLGADLLYAQRRGDSIGGAGTVQATVFRTGPQANPFYVNPPGVAEGTAAGDRQEITWDATDLVGPAHNLNDSDTHFGVFTAAYRLSDSWNLDFLASAGGDESTTRTTNNINGSVAFLALNGTTNGGGVTTAVSIPGTNVVRLQLPLTTANALDVWNPKATNRTSPDVIDALLDNDGRLTATSRYRQARLSAGGSLFALPAGAVKVAFGVERLETGLDQYRTRANNSGRASQGTQAQFYEFRREVNSAFAELNVPIISPEMNGVIRAFDLAISTRFDSYSDFGETTNPKVGFNLEAVQGLRLRGNWSSSFVAPPLTILGDQFGSFATAGFGASTNNVNVPVAAYPLVTQPGLLPGCAGQAQCNIGTLQGIQNTTGDPNAGPQEGDGWSLGFDTSAALIPGLRTAVTYWTTNFEGGVTGPQIANVINTASAQSLLTFYPNCATAAEIGAKTRGIPQITSLPSCTQYILHTLNTNWLNLYIAGVDYSIDYDHDVDFGLIHAGLSGTEFTKFQQSFGSGPTYDVLGTAGSNGTFAQIKSRARAYLGWSDGSIAVRAFANYTSGYKNWSSNTITPIVRDANGNPGGGGDDVDALWTFDLNASYGFEDGVLGGSRVTLSVINITDEEPPFYNGSTGHYALGANPFGRTVNLTFRARFN